MPNEPYERQRSGGNRNQPLYDVFVSYSHADKQIAEMLAQRLRDRGLSTFVDRENIATVQGWHDQVREAIDRSRLCIVLVSKKTDPSSPSISREWALIQDSTWRRSNLSICPVLVDDVPTPTFLRRWQEIRVSRASQDIEQVAQEISAVLRQSPTERAATISEYDASATAARFSEIADTLKTKLEGGG